jgi:hypothetical protein
LSTFAFVPCVFFLMFIGCSRFLSLILPRTRTSSSAARERTTHLVYRLCKCKFELVQTFLGTCVCLTQHPSDTLRPFRELSCLTMYILPHWSHTGWVKGCWISAPL